MSSIRPAGDPNAPVIALEDVHKRYGGSVAVEQATFDVPRGELFSLLGPSGCGKTTVLRLIGGFEAATRGRIRLDGVDVSGVPPYRRNVNTVFQQYALFPHLNVFDNVAFGPRAQGVDQATARQRVTRMLDVVRLGELAARRPDQLSGGQRQRVALARALVNVPSALLLDEPLSALDLSLRHAMQIELKRIQREVGITFVLVTHDQGEALALSDRIAVMREGRVEQVGTPEDVYHSPATAFVAGFIGTANLLPASVEQVNGRRATVRLAGGGRVEVAIGPGAFRPGGSGVLMLRPERIRLSSGPADPRWSAIPVQVGDVVFQGPVLRCVLRDGGGGEIIAHVVGDQRPPGLQRGADLWASWDPDAARLLPPLPAPIDVGE